MTFKALLIEKDDAGYRAAVKDVDDGVLGAGEVTVRVACRTINYKDGLAITGKSPVVRKFPLVAGIDFAGHRRGQRRRPLQARRPRAAERLGRGRKPQRRPGPARARQGRLAAAGADAAERRQAMAIGTAGYTAMLCVMALQRHGIAPGAGDILVTGASGGVGTVAISLLARLGYRVVASTGRLQEADFLGRWARPTWCRATNSAAPASRWPRNALPAWWTRWAATRWPTPAPPRATAARWPPAGWRRAWTSRQRGALHPAWRHAVRHRQRDGADGGAPGGVGAAGVDHGPGPAGRADHRGRAQPGGGAGPRDPGRARARAAGGRRCLLRRRAALGQQVVEVLLISASMVLAKAPSRKPSLASRSKWSAATISRPLTPVRVNSTVSLVSPSITVHSMSNFCFGMLGPLPGDLARLGQAQLVFAVDADVGHGRSLLQGTACSVARRWSLGKAARRRTSA
jgi:hypothetical protein